MSEARRRGTANHPAQPGRRIVRAKTRVLRDVTCRFSLRQNGVLLSAVRVAFGQTIMNTAPTISTTMNVLKAITVYSPVVSNIQPAKTGPMNVTGTRQNCTRPWMVAYRRLPK